MVPQPHYLLICDSVISSPATVNDQLMPSVGLGRWHFVLERMDGPERLEAADSESYIHLDRLALLAVVRGLEALEQSSLVRLVTTSRYVDRGLRFGLPNWRETNYQWESFGERKPVRNADLWRRVDVAMLYHKVTCRLLKGNVAAAESEGCEAQEFQQPMLVATTPAESETTRSSHVTQTTIAASNASAELVGRYSPTRIVYRIDAPQKHTPHSSQTRTPRPQSIGSKSLAAHVMQASRMANHQPQTVLHRRVSSSTALPMLEDASSSARLQWWEMAAKWDFSGSLAGSVPASASNQRRLQCEPAFS